MLVSCFSGVERLWFVGLPRVVDVGLFVVRRLGGVSFESPVIFGLRRGDSPRFIALGVGVGSVAMLFERVFGGVKLGWISLGACLILSVHVWGMVDSFLVLFLLSDEGKFGLAAGILCRCGSFGFGLGFVEVDDVFLLPSEFPAN